MEKQGAAVDLAARVAAGDRRALARAIRRRIPGARVFLSPEEGALGAARLAARLLRPPRALAREIFR